MTTVLATSNSITGGLLSWAIPIGVFLVVLVWWGAVLTIRAFKARQ